MMHSKFATICVLLGSLLEGTHGVGLATGDNRMIAYLGNWQACPTANQLAQYSHVVIAFAVSYTWSATKNICSPTCQIETPPICNNMANANLINQLHQAGKKVILSFGGAGMGGSWSGDVNDCWEYCYGREGQVVTRLVEIVAGKFADIDRKPILWDPVCSRFGFVWPCLSPHLILPDSPLLHYRA
jgi:hypothetical protein